MTDKVVLCLIHEGTCIRGKAVCFEPMKVDNITYCCCFVLANYLTDIGDFSDSELRAMAYESGISFDKMKLVYKQAINDHFRQFPGIVVERN